MHVPSKLVDVEQPLHHPGKEPEHTHLHGPMKCQDASFSFLKLCPPEPGCGRTAAVPQRAQPLCQQHTGPRMLRSSSTRPQQSCLRDTAPIRAEAPVPIAMTSSNYCADKIKVLSCFANIFEAPVTAAEVGVITRKNVSPL